MRQTAVAAFRWLAEYRTEWVRPDLVAGLTLAAYLLPAGIGDASLAGLASEAGLYACLFSGIVFWLFCSSKHTVITVTSALSLLIGASVGELSGGDPARHAAMAACVALMVASIAFAAWLVRAGNVVGFFSETVLVGFKAGLALYLASTQLPKLFGFKGTHGDFWEGAAYFISHLGETNRMALLIGAVALAVLIAGKLWLKNRPVAFIVVIGGIVAARLLNLQTHAAWRCSATCRRACRRWDCLAWTGTISISSCPWRWPASFLRLSRRPRSGACSLRSTADGSTPIRSFWPLAPAICWRGSAAGFR